jgi:hypothetical protein
LFGKKQVVRSLLSNAQDTDANTRCSAFMCLSYLVQGAFGEMTKYLDHVDAIKTNCRLLWQLGCLTVVYDDGLRHAIASRLAKKSEVRLTTLDTELSARLTVLYFMLESLRGDTKFASDIDSLNPPILLYWMEVITKLRWEEQPHFPLQKVLLIFWKCLLCQFGDKDKVGSTSYNRESRHH